MTLQHNQMRLTADDFIDWAMAQPTGRFELSDGEIVAMSPERVTHARVKLDAVVALRMAIRQAGLECEAMPDGMAVRIDDRTVYEPDALVRCGPKIDGEAVKVEDPVIVVEVVSPSSRGIDSGTKRVAYLRLPTLRHYLVLHTDSREVIHRRRDEAGSISVQILTDGALALDPPGLTIEIADFFASL